MHRRRAGDASSSCCTCAARWSPILTLPIGHPDGVRVVMSAQGLNANIMSLGGIAIAIGAMVDAAIIMVENAHKHLEHEATRPPGERRARWDVIRDAATEVGPTLFFSLLVITVSFLPVFTLEAQEGRLFTPARLHQDLLDGRRRPPIGDARPGPHGLLHPRPDLAGDSATRSIGSSSGPTTRPCCVLLRHGGAGAGGARWYWSRSPGSPSAARLGVHAAALRGRPPLHADHAARYVHHQGPADPPAGRQGLRSFPEVSRSSGRWAAPRRRPIPPASTCSRPPSSSSPEKEWRPGMTVERLVREMDQAIQFPGVTNAWTMPIKTRTDMLTTGIKTPVGIKIGGPDLDVLERIGREVEEVMRKSRDALGLRGARGRRQLPRHGDRPTGAGALRPQPGRRPGGHPDRHGRDDHHHHRRGPGALPGQPPLRAGAARHPRGAGARAGADPGRPAGPVGAARQGGDPRMAPWSSAARRRGRTRGCTWTSPASTWGPTSSKPDGRWRERAKLPPGYTLTWSGEYEYMQRAEQRLLFGHPAHRLHHLRDHLPQHTLARQDGDRVPRRPVLAGGCGVAPVPRRLQPEHRRVGGHDRARRARRRDRRGHAPVPRRGPQGVAQERSPAHAAATCGTRSTTAPCSGCGRRS